MCNRKCYNCASQVLQDDTAPLIVLCSLRSHVSMIYWFVSRDFLGIVKL